MVALLFLRLSRHFRSSPHCDAIREIAYIYILILPDYVVETRDVLGALGTAIIGDCCTRL